jgi:hypothetical protein
MRLNQDSPGASSVRKSVYDGTQVESVMQQVQKNIPCVWPGSILHESLNL